MTFTSFFFAFTGGSGVFPNTGFTPILYCLEHLNVNDKSGAWSLIYFATLTSYCHNVPDIF